MHHAASDALRRNGGVRVTPARRDEWLRALYAIALRVREMQGEARAIATTLRAAS